MVCSVTKSRPVLLAAVILAGLVAGWGAATPAPNVIAPVCHNWPFDAKEATRQQEETASELGIPVEKSIDLGGGVELELVLIPAGEFMMGGERYDGEKPVHKVRITQPFYAGKYEVTQEQWEKLIRRNLSYFRAARNPVEMVSWDDCQEFVRKLAEKASGHTFRLPTEAEWEYACRAGSNSAFCYGDNEGGLKDYAWYSESSPDKTRPVGGKKPNAWGLYDMHGNVQEWCQDWYGSYSSGEQTDPAGPATGECHVLRGGAWGGCLAPICRSAYRHNGTPDGRHPSFGFRVVCAACAD